MSSLFRSLDWLVFLHPLQFKTLIRNWLQSKKNSNGTKTTEKLPWKKKSKNSCFNSSCKQNKKKNILRSKKKTATEVEEGVAEEVVGANPEMTTRDRAEVVWLEELEPTLIDRSLNSKLKMTTKPTQLRLDSNRTGKHQSRQNRTWR